VFDPERRTSHRCHAARRDGNRPRPSNAEASLMSDPNGLERLWQIVAALRDPDSGCPWDIRQTFETIAPYTIEEAYEVADAISRANLTDLKDELGDLLFQVAFHARMAEEQGAFRLADVVDAICEKMLRRHPHVFGKGSERKRLDLDAVNGLWAATKAREKQGAADTASRSAGGVLDSVSTELPAFATATKLQRRAAEVGFDWPDATSVLDKIEEEAVEIREALKSGAPDSVSAEIGDLLFAVVNLARHARVDAEMALRKANLKFIARFQAVEAALAAAGKTPATSNLDEMEALWRAAKQKERQ
jgi:ATP diphosphatase